MIPDCKACSHCFMEPSDMDFVCGHPDAGSVGIYLHRAVATDGHCGPDRAKFEQHPLRNPDGTLKSTEMTADRPVVEQLEAHRQVRKAMFQDIVRVWNAFVAYREHDEDGTALDALLLFMDGSGRLLDSDDGLIVDWDTCDEAVERLRGLAGIEASGLDAGSDESS